MSPHYTTFFPLHRYMIAAPCGNCILWQSFKPLLQRSLHTSFLIWLKTMLGLHTNFAQWGQTFSGAMPTYHIITCIFRQRRHKATADFRQGSLAKPLPKLFKCSPNALYLSLYIPTSFFSRHICLSVTYVILHLQTLHGICWWSTGSPLGDS